MTSATGDVEMCQARAHGHGYARAHTHSSVFFFFEKTQYQDSEYKLLHLHERLRKLHAATNVPHHSKWIKEKKATVSQQITKLNNTSVQTVHLLKRKWTNLYLPVHPHPGAQNVTNSAKSVLLAAKAIVSVARYCCGAAHQLEAGTHRPSPPHFRWGLLLFTVNLRLLSVGIKPKTFKNNNKSNP